MKKNISQIHRGKNSADKRTPTSMPNFIDRYMHSIDSMKKLCDSFLQVFFYLSYPHYVFIEPKYEHIHIFNYVFKKSIIQECCENDHTRIQKIFWTRNYDNKYDQFFIYLILIKGESISISNDINRIAKEKWALTLGSSLSNMAKIHPEDKLTTLQNNGLVFCSGLSQAKKIAVEKLMLQQAMHMAQIVDREPLEISA